MEVRNLNHVPAFATKDGSEVRELLSPRNAPLRNQSLAEARLPVGGSTREHYHSRTEEIYFITSGRGRMRIADELRDVTAGDAIAIPPGSRHKLWNIGTEPLHLLCFCAPAYEHDDTTLTEARPPDTSPDAASPRPSTPRIRLFIKSHCPWCTLAMDWLDRHHLPYDIIEVRADRAAFEEMRRLSGQTLAPVLEVEGHVLADFGPDELAAFWEKRQRPQPAGR